MQEIFEYTVVTGTIWLLSYIKITGSYCCSHLKCGHGLTSVFVFCSVLPACANA